MHRYPPDHMTIEEFIDLLMEELSEYKEEEEKEEDAQIIYCDFINKKEIPTKE